MLLVHLKGKVKSRQRRLWHNLNFKTWQIIKNIWNLGRLTHPVDIKNAGFVLVKNVVKCQSILERFREGSHGDNWAEPWDGLLTPSQKGSFLWNKNSLNLNCMTNVEGKIPYTMSGRGRAFIPLLNWKPRMIFHTNARVIFGFPSTMSPALMFRRETLCKHKGRK